MIWGPTSIPPMAFHVFLSHTSVDKPWLLDPLDRELADAGITAWYDRRHFPRATDGFEALRTGLVASRHVVYLITQATLENRRGWQLLERCYAALLQDVFRRHGRELVHLELPLIYLPDDVETREKLGLSIWQPLLTKARFCPPGTRDAVGWAVHEIRQFLRQEERHADAMASAYRGDIAFRRDTDVLEDSVAGSRVRALDIPPSFRL